MADTWDVQIRAQGNVSKMISGSALQDAFTFNPNALVTACEKAAQPGLSALRMNVSRIRRVTGRLASAPAVITRFYRRRRSGVVAMALVGYRAKVAPHASLIEFGTKMRRSSRGNRGQAPARRPLTRAFEASRPAMQSALTRELQSLMESGLSAAQR